MLARKACSGVEMTGRQLRSDFSFGDQVFAKVALVKNSKSLKYLKDFDLFLHIITLANFAAI